jgi:hypothetical protein
MIGRKSRKIVAELLQMERSTGRVDPAWRQPVRFGQDGQDGCENIKSPRSFEYERESVPDQSR